MIVANFLEFASFFAASSGEFTSSPIFYITVVLFLGILAQWVAWRCRLPSILILLAFGYFAGQAFGLKIDSFLGDNSEKLILDIVGLCVAIILFEGGLTLKFSELRQSGNSVIRMCTIGVAVAFVATTLTCMFLLPIVDRESFHLENFGLNWRLAAVLGAILVVTGPTVIAPLIRHIQPSRKIASIVKWEGIVVDPIGAILAVLIFQVALAEDLGSAQLGVLFALGKTLFIGGLLAYLIAKGIEKMLKHHLIPDFLHSVFLLSVVAISFSLSNAIQAESGLLTVTVLGIALANQRSVSVKHILEFKENLRVLIISGLFIVLSGRIEADRLVTALPTGLTLLFFLIVIIRPLSVFIANLFTHKASIKEQIFLSMLAPRGIVAAAVTSIFALEFHYVVSQGAFKDPALAATIDRQADLLEPIVFIVIVGTVTFYGLLAAPLARRLQISKKNPSGVLFAGANPWARRIAKQLYEDGHEVLMLDTNYSHVAAANVEGIPAKRANILSEYVEEELELNGLSLLMATTTNDEINSLAAKEFTHIFGSANVWQIAPDDDGAHHTTAVAANLRGRICFTGRPNNDELEAIVEQGASVKNINLTEQYTYDDFLERYGARAIVCFLFSSDKGLRPATDDMKKPSAGTMLYALVLPHEKSLTTNPVNS